MSSPAADAPRFRERLWCPVSYWLISFAVGLTFVTAVGWYLGPWFAAGAGIVTAAGLVVFLGGIGQLEIVVDDRGLRVGGSLLEWEYQGTASTLDAVAARDRLGVGADTRAFVAERPYIAEAVEVPVRDAADPHPYWFVATRRPAQLALALADGRAEHSEAAA